MRIFQTATHKLMNKKQFQSIYREVRIGFFPFTNYHASCFSELENKVMDAAFDARLTRNTVREYKYLVHRFANGYKAFSSPIDALRYAKSIGKNFTKYTSSNLCYQRQTATQ